ncbi:MAG: hypothetical protein ACLFTE_08685 [Salinivenus sp.]
MGIGVGALLLAGLLLFGLTMTDRFGHDTPDGPPGEVWPEAHGHCH